MEEENEFASELEKGLPDTIQNEICKAIRENPRTVPEVAEITGLPTNIVLWYMTAYKKYGIVVESGMCGDYPLYLKAGK